MTNSRSANRHMRGDSERRLNNLRQERRSVLVRADPEYASKPAGQHLLQMTVNLLARQYEVVQEIILDVPETPVLERVFHGPPSNHASLNSRLLNFAKAIAGPEIIVIPVDASLGSASFPTIYIGPFDPSINPIFGVSVSAEGSRFDCATNRQSQPVIGLDSNPLGPYMAACFAASAIFKYFWRLDATIDLSGTLWDCTAANWNALASGNNLSHIAIPTTYLLGCGAVGAAFAFTLAAISDIEGEIIAIDPQESDETNRNRLLTMSYNDIEKKVFLTERLFVGTKIKLYPYVGQWPDYTADTNRNIPAHIRKSEETYRYEWVLSCVDRNHHRRAIAAYLPRNIFGGSTYDFAAQVAIYSMQGHCECLACNHPSPKGKPTDELRTLLLSMTTDDLRIWFDKHDVDNRERAAIEEYLQDPNCGGIGHAMLAKLGREGETDWSVGFVSVAAGVLLASVFLRAVLEGTGIVTDNGPEYFAWFFRAALGASRALRKPDCDLCGSEDKQSIFSTLWGGTPGIES